MAIDKTLVAVTSMAMSATSFQATVTRPLQVVCASEGPMYSYRLPNSATVQLGTLQRTVPALPTAWEIAVMALPGGRSGGIATVGHMENINQLGHEALVAISSMKNRPAAVVASSTVRKIVSAARRLRIARLPPLSAIESDDGSILVEWIFNQRRIGVAIELNVRESSWYYASSIAMGSELLSGPLVAIDVDGLVYKVVRAAQL